MNDVSSAAPVLNQLEKSLVSGNLSADAKQKGEYLLARLKSPVRTVILGLSGSGKSQLLNFLAGRRIVLSDAALPPLELSWAEQSRTIVTRNDGTLETRDGIILEELAGTDAEFVKIEAALPILEQISLLEVGVHGSIDSQTDTIDWAIGRADIILWCSQDFGAEERELWSRVPDALKDHSFLVLTKADAVSSPGDLQTKISDLQDVVAEEFHSLFPLATLQAISASQQDGAIDKSVLSASGGAALIAAILRQVELGRQADIDGVFLFLNRYGLISSALTRPAQNKTTDVAAAGNDARLINEGDDSIRLSTSDLFSSALDYLRERAADLTDIQPESGLENSSDILKHCTETAINLADIFVEDDYRTPGPSEFQDVLAEATDMVLLMWLEDGDGAAADAVTMLLQLRRDIEMNIAA